MTAAYAIVRILHFACLMAVFGASALRAQAKHIGHPKESLRRPLTFAAFGALATAILSLVAVGGEMSGAALAGFRPEVFMAVVLHTDYGNVCVIRVAVLVGVCVLTMRTANTSLTALASGAALALIALTSHAAAAGSPAHAYLRAANDAVHLLAAGFWFGGLIALAPEVAPRIADRKRVVALLTLFSRWGVVSVAVLLAAGTTDAVMILGMDGMPWSGTYVTLLAVKIVAAGLMVALALTNKFAVLPALARGDKDAEETIPMTVLAELGAALLILCIVGVLGTIAPMQM